MSSSGYKSIPLGAHSKKGTSISILEDSERPHLYSTPVVSAPLITWFGLPTIIEFEQPAPEGIAQVEESEFKSIKGGSRLNNNLSRSAYSTDTVSNGDHQQQRRALSKSLFSEGGASLTDTDDHCISAYTYRVRSMAKPSLDEHRLRLRQNIDGTYSHVDSLGVATTMPNGDFGIDDAPDSDTGLLMMSHGENHKASISLDTVLDLEDAISNMENKTLPPHTHPSIPIEILQPEHTRTAPPLKLWPLAVLVFYSEFRGCISIEFLWNQ
jgi:hypothetical protein